MNNYLNMPKLDQQRGLVQRNAMNMANEQEDRALYEDAMSEQQRIENTQWMAEIGRYGQEQMSQDPNAYIKLMPMIEEEGKRRGMWEKIGIDYTTASPEEVLQGFQNMEQQAQLGLAGMGQEDPKLVKDAAGYQRYAGGDQFGERAFPDVERPPPGQSGGMTGSLQELHAINTDREARGESPMQPELYLKDRRRSSADMQAYRQYVIDAQKAGVPPISENEGGVAGSKTTGSGRAQRQLDRPQAQEMYSQTTHNLTRLSEDVTALANNDNLWKAVGLSKSIALVPGQEGADIKAAIHNLKSQIGFMVLQNMRNASKTGGALGQVSEKENELLQDNLASLDTNQSPEAFKRGLARILDYLRESQSRADNAWKSAYPDLDYSGQANDQPTDDFQSQWDAAPTATGPNGEKLVLQNGQWVPQ